MLQGGNNYAMPYSAALWHMSICSHRSWSCISLAAPGCMLQSAQCRSSVLFMRMVQSFLLLTLTLSLLLSHVACAMAFANQANGCGTDAMEVTSASYPGLLTKSFSP